MEQVLFLGAGDFGKANCWVLCQPGDDEVADVSAEELVRLTGECHATTRRIDVMPEGALEEASTGGREVPVCPEHGDLGGALQIPNKCDENSTIES